MSPTNRPANWIVAALALAGVLVSCALLTPVVAGALAAPHVPTVTDTDACAICHRGHTSASGITARGSDGTSFSALTVGSYTGEAGDTQLCFSCHGIGALGSTLDIESDFGEGVGHVLAPSASSFGPSPKQCGDCHDSHGSDRDTSGTPYPGLLRAKTTTSSVFSGNAYCGVCHKDRPADIFSGIAVFENTGHGEIAPTASGTGIVCSACHVPHGSPNRPLIVSRLSTPSAPATASVTTSGRTLCFGCHAAVETSYPGTTTFQASAHGSSVETVAIVGEWVGRLPAGSAETSRAVGECANCHNAMGAVDSSGSPIPKLAVASEEQLCFRCHGIGSTVSTDVASVVASPSGAIAELIAGYGLPGAAAPFDRMQLYTRESTATTAMVGPRQYLGGRVGPAVAGDVDGDGETEIVVTRTNAATATVFSRSALRGIEPVPGDRALLASATALALGDVIADVDGLPELVTGNGSTVLIYRWNGVTFTPLATSVTVTGTITGLATGQVSGTSQHEIVVTESLPGNTADEITVITGATGSLAVSNTFTTINGAEPAGPSVGDLSGDGLGEIAVANTGHPTNGLTVYTPSGLSTDYAGSAGRARQTAIADFFHGVSAVGRTGAEVIVTMSDGGAASGVDVFPQTVSGTLAAPSTQAFAAGTGACGVAPGDLDGDARLELGVVGSGHAPSGIGPRTWIADTNAAGTGFGGLTELLASGAESADTVARGAWALVAEMGPVGTSRHVVTAVNGAHVSTESAGFSPRHVECADCHNSHTATSTVAAAPAVYGELRGAWGVTVLNAPAGSITYTEKQGVSREYELCLKCHGGWSAVGTTRDIAAEVDTRNASFHSIEGTSAASQATSGSFETGWSNASMLYCKDCHGRSFVSGPRGPHASPSAPLLVKRFWGVAPGDASGVCFSCHRRDVYYTGGADGVPASTSQFYDSSLPGTERDLLHSWHTLAKGLGCEACHVSHGAPREHMIRSDVGYVHSPTGGGCTVACHSSLPAFTSSYSRP